MMKSAVLIGCSIVFLLLVSVGLQSMDENALSFPSSSTALRQGISDQAPSLFEGAKATIQKTIVVMTGEEQGGNHKEKTPYALLLITGLFGFSFWGRSSFKNGFGRGLRQN